MTISPIMQILALTHRYYFAEIHYLQEARRVFEGTFDQMYESLMKLKKYLKIPESIVGMNILLII